MSVYKPKTTSEPKTPPVPFSVATVTRSAIDEATSRAERAEQERDRFEAALGRACLVGGTTYLIERAERAEAEVARLSKINVDLCRDFNTLLIDGARLEDRIRDLEITLRDLHKAATQVSKLGATTGPQWSKLTVELLKSFEIMTKVQHKAMGGHADESEGFP